MSLVQKFQFLETEIAEKKREYEELKNRLDLKQRELRELQNEKDTTRLRILGMSASKYREKRQKCTCDTGLNPDEEHYPVVKCRRHLSRYSKNKGCGMCEFTDCSEFHC